MNILLPGLWRKTICWARDLFGDGLFAVDQSTSEKRAKKEGLLYYGQPDPLGFNQLKEAWDSRELLLGFFQRDLLIRYR